MHGSLLWQLERQYTFRENMSQILKYPLLPIVGGIKFHAKQAHRELTRNICGSAGKIQSLNMITFFKDVLMYHSRQHLDLLLQNEKLKEVGYASPDVDRYDFHLERKKSSTTIYAAAFKLNVHWFI